MVAAAVGTPLTKVHVTPRGHAAHVVAVLAAPRVIQFPAVQAVHAVRAPAITVAAKPAVQPGVGNTSPDTQWVVGNEEEASQQKTNES